MLEELLLLLGNFHDNETTSQVQQKHHEADKIHVGVEEAKNCVKRRQNGYRCDNRMRYKTGETHL
jgi:hypothetical protein